MSIDFFKYIYVLVLEPTATYIIHKSSHDQNYTVHLSPKKQLLLFIYSIIRHAYLIFNSANGSFLTVVMGNGHARARFCPPATL